MAKASPSRALQTEAAVTPRQRQLGMATWTHGKTATILEAR